MITEENVLNQKIENVNFSVRAFNCLKRNNINTIAELIILNRNDLLHFKNLGIRTVDEIETIITKLQQEDYTIINDNGISDLADENDTLLEWAWGRKCELNACTFYSLTGEIVDDLSIYEMGLSVRSFNGLMKRGINSLSLLSQIKKKDFLKIKNLGKKSAIEILEKIRVLTNVDEEQVIDFVPVKSYIADFECEEYRPDFLQLKSQAILFLHKYQLENRYYFYGEKCANDDILDSMMNNTYFRGLLQKHIMDMVQRRKGVFSTELNTIFPGKLKKYQEKCIKYCLQNKTIEVQDEKIIIKLSTFKEYVNTIENERVKICIEQRVNGKTLEEIGMELGVTRERIRQIIMKGIAKRPKLKEDTYVGYYEKYNFNLERIKYIFRMDEYSFIYFDMVVQKRGTQDVSEMIDDLNVPESIKNRVEKYLYCNYIDVGKEKIMCRRNEILEYLLRTYCKDEVSIEEIQALFDEFLVEHGLENEEGLKYPERYFRTKLATNEKILWKHGKRLRYYDISEAEFNDLLSLLEFESLDDIEISTKYFMLNFPDVIEQYDIRDEYELHNLLKKRLEGRKNVNFLRMPNISIGDANRDMQVLDLLIREAPISNVDLAMKYEELYGVNANTVMANYFKCIDEYFYNGMYSIDFRDLTQEEFEYLKGELTDSVYEIAYVKKIFTDRFPNSGMDKMSSYNYKRLGFKVSVNLLYSSDYSNADKFFRDFISKNSIFDLTGHEWLLKNQTCYGIINELRNDYKIIEFTPYKYISIEKLQGHGIYRKDIEKYCKAACDFSKGKYFSIYSLKKDGFEDELDELGFDDLFYVSLLKAYQGCRYHRIDNQYIFREGVEPVEIYNLIQDIIYETGSINVYDLIDYLKDTYGFNIDKYKLCKYTEEAELFYSPTMEKIYFDYEQFFEEV